LCRAGAPQWNRRHHSLDVISRVVVKGGEPQTSLDVAGAYTVGTYACSALLPRYASNQHLNGRLRCCRKDVPRWGAIDSCRDDRNNRTASLRTQVRQNSGNYVEAAVDIAVDGARPRLRSNLTDVEELDRGTGRVHHRMNPTEAPRNLVYEGLHSVG